MKTFLGKKSLFLIIVLVTVVFFIAFLVFGTVGDNVTGNQEVEELTYDEFSVVKDEYIKLLIDSDPRAALTKLRREIKDNKRLLASCHPLVHEIGHASYEKYGSFGEVMQFQDEICNSGYIHGALESYFGTGLDITLALNSVCSEYPADTFLGWECYHGVGHGLMYYTANDLNSSLLMCDTYDDLSKRDSCVNGVFMENFNTDQKGHFSSYLKEDNPFYPCEEQESRNKPYCYFYSPTYYLHLTNNDYIGALNWCESAESEFAFMCVRGVGGEAIKRNIEDPLFVEKICESGPKQQVGQCIIGMVDLYINHHGSYRPAQEMCKLLKDRNKDICLEVVYASLGLFR